MRCVAGCFRCCLKADIRCSVLECLPLAHFLLQTGAWPLVLHDIEARERHGDGRCVLLSETPSEGEAGCCRAYAWRPLICRLFGRSVAVNRRGEAVPFACASIKQTWSEAFTRSRGGAPVMRRYTLQLFAVDPATVLASLPINDALSEAIEGLLLYNRYRRLRLGR